MNKKQERREAKQSEKDQRTHGNEARFHCPFPGCGKIFWNEPGKPNVCPDHRKLIADVMFILDHTKTPAAVQEPTENGPKIFIPKPGMADQAIAEELKRKGGKP